MTVVSGETGAGKSIMLDALGLSLGARAQSDCVREGTDRAEITACFDIRNLSEARDWLAEHELEGDEECQLRRVITREGRSRSFINGRPTPLTQVRELGQLLVNIHGQHEHQRLLKKDHHRTLLDEYAGQAELAEQVRAAYQRWRRLYGELTQLTELSTEQSARVQLLSYQIEELDQLALSDGELQALEAEQRTLANAEEILATGPPAAGAHRRGWRRGKLPEPAHPLPAAAGKTGQPRPGAATSRRNAGQRADPDRRIGP